MVTVIVEEKTPEQRLDDIELELHGTGEKGADPGLLELVNTKVMGVLGNHEKRLQSLEPPAGHPRDWLRVTDKEVAAQWLDELDQWHGRVLKYVIPGLLDKPCWLWHPAVVARLLILQGLWVSAKNPDRAAMLWTRHLTDLTKGINEVGGINSCSKDYRHKGLGCGHVEELPDGTERSDWVLTKTTTDAGRDLLRDDYLTWWCGSREGIPPGLMPA